MTNEELVAEVAELKSALFAVGSLAQTLADQVTKGHEDHALAAERIMGIIQGQTALIHALAAAFLRNNDLGQKVFDLMLGIKVQLMEGALDSGSEANFNNTVQNMRVWVEEVNNF